MAGGRTGLAARAAYSTTPASTSTYRRQRLAAFAAPLGHPGLMRGPVVEP
jgi:hypothetical protein